MALVRHPLRDLVRGLFRLEKHSQLVLVVREEVIHLAEDDALSDRQKVVQSDQCVVLDVLGLTIEVELGDGVHRDFVPLQLDLVRSGGEVVDMSLDLVTKCGREQHQLTVGR